MTHYGRRQSWLRDRERVARTAVAAFLALTVALFLRNAAMPIELQLTALIAILVLAMRDATWGYVAAIGALIWPLYQLSPLLMVLVVAPLILLRTWLVPRLGWALLVLMAPVLATWQLLALPPLLAGIIGGKRLGFWVGASAALWTKLFAGLAGVAVPELGSLHGLSLAFEQIATRLAAVEGIALVPLLLGAAFGDGPTLAVMHLVQIGLWGASGWLAGELHQNHGWKHGLKLPVVHTLTAPLILLWLAIYIVPATFGIQPWLAFMKYPGPTIGLAVSALTVSLLLIVAKWLSAASKPTGPARRGSHITTRRTTMAARVDGVQEEEEPLLIELE